MTETTCYDCKQPKALADTEIVTEPVIREGKTYHGMATSWQRRVCSTCRALLETVAPNANPEWLPEPKTIEWSFELTYTYQGKTRKPTRRLTMPADKTEHQAMIRVIQEWTRAHVEAAELLSVVLVHSRAF
jgi:hypothetical protein